MKNKIAFVYMLIVVLLIFMFSFSFAIEYRKDVKETQRVEQTLTAGTKQFHIQLTALAERTPEP